MRRGWVNSSFAAGPARLLPLAQVPTRWQLMLQDLELTEQDARGLLARPGTRALRLRLWIQANYRSRYVPPDCLTPEQAETFAWE